MSRRKGRPASAAGDRWWLPAAFLCGAVAFAAQQLTLRELLVIHSENALFAGVALGTWLLAGGAAALLARGAAPITEPRALVLLAVAGALTPLCVAACRLLWWLHPVRASVGDLGLIALIVEGPCAAATSLLFAGLARGRPDAPTVLALECLGALAGLALHLYARSLCAPPLTLGVVIALSACLWSAARCRAGAALRARCVPVAAALAIGLAALALAPAAEQATLARVWNPLQLVFSLDTSWSRVSVLRKPAFMGGTLRFYVNRFPMWAIEDDAGHNEGLVHLPLLLHPDPRRVLIVGGGVGGNAREALAEPTREVVLCELEPAVLAAGRWIFPRENRGALDSPRLIALQMDGGRFLKEDPGQFDAILLDLPDPYVPQLARFYSRDFLTSARARLKAGGLLAIQLPPARDPQGPIAHANRLLARTFRAAFPDTTAVFARMDYLVGFNGPAASPDRLAEMLARRGLKLRALTPDLLDQNRTGHPERARRLGYLDLPDPLAERISTDDRPVALGHDLYFWESVGNRGAALVPELAARAPPWALALLIALVALAAAAGAARVGGGPLAGLVFSGGLITQALATLVLYQVQTRVGTVLATAPLLGAAALAGHGVGALVPGTIVAPRALALVLALVGATVPPLLWQVTPASAVPAAAAALFLAGTLAGALWTAALRRGGTAPRLYGADLCGAALAAFVLLPVGLPFAGVTLSAAALAGSLALRASFASQ